MIPKVWLNVEKTKAVIESWISDDFKEYKKLVEEIAVKYLQNKSSKELYSILTMMLTVCGVEEIHSCLDSGYSYSECVETTLTRIVASASLSMDFIEKVTNELKFAGKYV